MIKKTVLVTCDVATKPGNTFLQQHARDIDDSETICQFMKYAKIDRPIIEGKVKEVPGAIGFLSVFKEMEIQEIQFVNMPFKNVSGPLVSTGYLSKAQMTPGIELFYHSINL